MLRDCPVGAARTEMANPRPVTSPPATKKAMANFFKAESPAVSYHVPEGPNLASTQLLSALSR